jgi:protein tyrosine/serine phosphatase
MKVESSKENRALGDNAGGTSPVVVSAPIPNFRKVTAWLYRGGQPDAAGFRYLQTLEVRTVVSLRWRRTAISEERRLAQEFKINYVGFPLNYWTFPSLEIVRQFLAILDDQERRPVYVHCFHGSDRTGLLLAIYRMAREGWSADQAYSEMRRCGFHLFRMYHFKWAVYYFESLLKKKQLV